MRCPICNKVVAHRENPYRPFCSERCKLIDLDNWFSGRYRIPVNGAQVSQTSPVPADESDRDEKAELD
jgi:endogenous inhibitor of DNA gyrase (YacG/DUF329 family)